MASSLVLTGNGQRQDHAGDAIACGSSQRKGGENGTNIALIEVSAHAGHVTDIVTDVVSDGSGVTGVILRDTGLDLTDKVSAHVGSLGEDAAAHTAKQSHEGSAHAKHDHGVGHILSGQLGDLQQDGQPDGNIQQAQAYHGEAHDGAGGECNIETLVQTLRSSLSGTGVCVGGDLHADEASKGRPDAAGDECEGDEPVVKHAHCGKNQQQDEDDDENLCNGGVLMLQISICTFPDCRRDFHHSFIAL